VHRQRAEYSIEGAGGVWQCFFIIKDCARKGELVVEGEGVITVEHRGGGIYGCEAADALGHGLFGGWRGDVVAAHVGGLGQGARDVAGVCAVVEDIVEAAVDVLDGGCKLVEWT